MPVTFLRFGPFTPGGSKYGDGLARADNCLPLYGGLYPLRGKTAIPYASMSDGPITGAHNHAWPVNPGAASYAGDFVTTIAGTKTRLYHVVGGGPGTGFTDISRGALYAQAAGDNPPGWRFTSFGNHVYATNLVDPIQKRTNNAGNFADMPGASVFKPECRFLAPVREFMVAAHIANLTDWSDGFAWSDVDDPDWWDDDSGARDTSLAGSKRIVTRPGQITGLVGGPHGTIYKRNSIHLLQYVGGSDLWRLDEIANGIGCAYPGSLVDAPTGKYFFDGQTFRRQVGYEYPEAICPPEVAQLVNDRHHFSDRAFIHAILATMGQEDAVMQGFYGERTGLIYWLWANTTVDGTNGIASHDRGLVYNPATGGWGPISRPAQLGITCAASQFPYVDTRVDFALDRMEIFTWEPTVPETTYVRFDDGISAATIRTKRQPVAFDGATRQPVRVHVKGVLPAFTVPDGSTFSASPSMPTVPDASITATAGNTPWHETQTDNGTTVSPRSDGPYTRTSHADDYGWFPVSMEGSWWEFEVSLPSAEWIAFDGLYVDFEAVGQ